MKKNIYSLLATFSLLIAFNGCTEKDYELGDLTAPSDVMINAEVIGKDATHPNGDGSGNVKFTVSAKNGLSYKIDYDASDPVDLVHLPTGTITKKYTKLGLNTYRVTVVAYGRGGTSTTVTQDVIVRSDFIVPAQIVADLTGGSSKTWVVDKNASGHMGVGPWSGSGTPEWWAAAPNEKAGCCNCFYTASFTFTKVTANDTYTLQANTPDGAFTKTGALTTLPGIPASGGEGCYSYSGGTSNFTFVPASTTLPGSVATTKTTIQLAGNSTFIGYGAVLKEYEILSLSPTNMYLRVQGTETGNAWYLKLIPR